MTAYSTKTFDVSVLDDAGYEIEFTVDVEAEFTLETSGMDADGNRSRDHFELTNWTLMSDMGDESYEIRLRVIRAINAKIGKLDWAPTRK